ncbi:N-acetylmuramoyl-L-alanine amidase [Candidatus Uhrbacteria bacterium]|nr:N-acetylmuramoyl-L-alanine amidase [Candidatus Uhrbacteria bacterium]
MIDPGHGGLDDGSSGIVDGQRVVEDEHVYDIALRLRDFVRAGGGRAELTITDPKQTRPTENRTGRYLTDDRNEHVVGRGCAPLTAGTRCLNARLAAGRSFVKRNWHRRVVWVSIHYDIGGTGTEGAVVLVPSTGATRSARAVASALASHPDRTRSRNGKPVDDILRSGDRSHGIRRLYILGRKNPFPERMLVELGNFRNADDLWRIRDPRIRQEFARRLASGIITWAQVPVPQPPKSRPRVVRR